MNTHRALVEGNDNFEDTEGDEGIILTWILGKRM